MTSGLSLAISVELTPSASEYWAGALAEPNPAPSLSSAASFQGVEPLPLPPHSFLGRPTGTTPSAMATSSFTQDTVATRVGCFSMVVLPNTCSMVTGNAVLPLELPASATVVAGPVLYADRVRAAAASTEAAFPAEENSVRRVGTGPGKRGNDTGLLESGWSKLK